MPSEHLCASADQPSLCCHGSDATLGLCFHPVGLADSSDGNSEGFEDDTGTEHSDGTDGEDEEGDLEDGSGENMCI